MMLTFSYTQQDIIDEIDSIAVLAKITGYSVSITGLATYHTIYHVKKDKSLYQLHVYKKEDNNTSDIYLIWFEKMNENLKCSSSAANDNLMFPLNVFKMIL